MQQLFTREGDAVLVDNADVAWAAQHTWITVQGSNTYYAARYEKGIGMIPMHRELMKAPPHLWVDHRDWRGWNNQRANMRLCTVAQNTANQRPRAASNFRGVYKHKARPVWFAQIKYGGKCYFLGCYKTPDEAAFAWDARAREVWEEFAYQNLPL